MSRQRIGELLLSRGVISEAQLNQGLDAQRQTQRRLGVTLVELGFLSEEQLASALADVLRLPRVDLSQVSVDWSAVHLLKPQFCEARGLFPFGWETGNGRKQLLIAMSDPSDVQALEEIEFTTGLKVQTRVASLSGVRASILRYYHRVQAPEAGPRANAIPLTTPVPGPRPRANAIPVTTPVPRPRANAIPLTTPVPGPRPSPPPAHGPPGEPAPTGRQAMEPSRAESGSSAPGAKPPTTVAENLDFLFGSERTQGDPAQRLDTLVRLLIRKGVITEADWLDALRERGVY